MSRYITSFKQQWVGDHSVEWFAGRGSLASAVVPDHAAARVWGGRIAEACGWPQQIRRVY